MIYTVTLNTAIDKIIHLDGILTRKKNNKILSYSYDIGGKATHVSTVLSEFNLDNVATGFTGMENEEKLISLLQDKKVTCDFISQPGCSTRETLVLIDEAGKGSFMMTDGGFTITKESQYKLKEKLNQYIKKDDYIVFAGSPPRGMSTEEYLSIVRSATKTGAKLIMDVNGELLKEVIKLRPYVIKPNEDEFQELVGRPVHTVDEFMDEIMKLLNVGIQYVIVSLGKRGSLVGHANRVYKVTPPKITEVNDTGCGDVFVGGIVAGLQKDLPVEEMLCLATALSASSASQKESSAFSLEHAKQLESKVIVEKLGTQEVL